jgi:hypothetical protein
LRLAIDRQATVWVFMSFHAEYVAELRSLLRNAEPAGLHVGLDALTYSQAPPELLPELLVLALFHPAQEIRQQAGQIVQTSSTLVNTANSLTTTRTEVQPEDVRTLLLQALAYPGIDPVRVYEASLPYISEVWEKIPLSALLERSQSLFLRRCRDLAQQHHALDLSHCHLRMLPEQLLSLPGLQRLSLNDNPGFEIRQVLVQAAQIPTLKELSLRQNKLTVLPAEIQLLSELVSLDLSYNALPGLPVELHRLRHLRRIQLYSNPLYNFTYFERFFENTHHLPYTNYHLFQAMYHDLNYSIVHIRSYNIICLFIEHFGIQRLIYRLLQSQNLEQIKKFCGQKFLLKIVADDMLSLKNGKGDLSQREFEALAVHLHILYLDEAARCLVAEVGEQRSGEVIAALLESKNRVLFTCHYV